MNNLSKKIYFSRIFLRIFACKWVRERMGVIKRKLISQQKLSQAHIKGFVEQGRFEPCRSVPGRRGGGGNNKTRKKKP